MSSLAKVPEPGDAHSSALVNESFAEHVDRIARRDELRELLDGWGRFVGPVGADDANAAAAAFDELEGSGSIVRSSMVARSSFRA